MPAKSTSVRYTLKDLLELRRTSAGTLGPARRTACYQDSAEGSPAVEIDIEIDSEGDSRVTGVRVSAAEDGREIRSADLRGLPFDSLVNMAMKAITAEIRQNWITLPTDPALTAWTLPRRSSRRRVNDDTLERVAKAYRASVAEGGNPQIDVASSFGVSTRSAGRYIARARDRGFLGPSLGPGVRGEDTDPKDTDA
jgi:hypothetical protein